MILIMGKLERRNLSVPASFPLMSFVCPFIVLQYHTSVPGLPIARVGHKSRTSAPTLKRCMVGTLR